MSHFNIIYHFKSTYIIRAKLLITNFIFSNTLYYWKCIGANFDSKMSKKYKSLYHGCKQTKAIILNMYDKLTNI